MKPDDYRNGDGGATSAASRSDDSEGEETSALEEELSLCDPEAPARVLAALNSLRKARQHFDVLLSAGGEEVAAHRAVLAAVSPRLLTSLGAAGPVADAVPLTDVDPDALREIVEYAYTGRLCVRDPCAARRLYIAAARLRVESVRAHLAERLLRRLAPPDCLAVRALPDLSPTHRGQLDTYIAQNFDDICASGALSSLPLIRIELLRETSAEGGEEAPAAVADAALAWLRDRQITDVALEELCARTHLLYVDASGELRDCGELPAARGDAPELQEYRRERERERTLRKRDHDRAAEDDARECTVIAARAGGSAVNGGGSGGAGGSGVTRAVVMVRGRLAAARVAWRTGSAEGPRGGRLGSARPDDPPEQLEADDGDALAHMSVGRCAMGAAVVGGRLVVCGGYDRARVLRAAEAYDPETNEWSALPDMKKARARFPAARLGESLFVFGGSDGQAELDSVGVLEGGAWAARAAMPLARSYAAAAADEASGTLYVAGGWTAGRSLRQVHRYDPKENQWSDAPPLNTGRSQCAGVVWAGSLWVLGGCDAWNCLASTEHLPLDGVATAWRPGPPLPTARRSVGAASWRGRLVVAGGSAGGTSLRDTALLIDTHADGASSAVASTPTERSWRPGPPLRRARAAPALEALTDTLYAVGGYSGKQFLACVECLHHPDGEWTTLLSHSGPNAALSYTAPVENGTQENGVQENGATP